MIPSIKLKLISITKFLHLKFFGYEMSEAMRRFLSHLSWSFFGGIISGVIMFILNIFAGRLLGPEEYGKYGLIIAIASIFIIPMTIGIDTAATFYIARTTSIKEKKEYASVSFWIILALISITAPILLFAFPMWENLFNLQKEIIIIAIIFSVLSALRNISDGIIKGFHLFKFQSFLRIAEASLVFVVFLILVKIFGVLKFSSYVEAVAAGYILVIILIFFKIIKNLLSFNLNYSKRLLSYGAIAIFGSIAGIMLNSVDKIFVNKYLGLEQLGVYNAYMTVSFISISQVTALFINVFFPFLAFIRSDRSTLNKINKLFKFFSLPLFLFLYLTIYIALLFFGNQYGFNWILAMEFSFFATMSMYFTVLWWLIASKGTNGIKFTTYNGIVAGLILVILLFIFRRNLSLNYAIIFLIIATLYAILIGNLKYEKIK